MNGEEKKDNPSLNTIYEEFDLSDRIKSLKGKHIKIKKIVKKEDGDYTIRETSLFSDKSIDQGQPVEVGTHANKDKEFNYQFTGNVLPADVNFQKHSSNSPGNSDFQFKKDYKSFVSPSFDYSSIGGFKREPVMPLSTTYTPKQPLFQSGAPRELIPEIFSSGIKPDFHTSYSIDLLGNYESPAKSKKLGGLTLDSKIESDTLSLLARAGPGLMTADAKKNPGIGSMFSFGKQGPMYQSNYIEEPVRRSVKHSNSGITDSNPKTPLGDKLRNSGLMKTSNYNEMPLSQYYDNVLSTRAQQRDRSRDQNPMFRSQSMNRSGSSIERGEPNAKDLTMFTLPADVIKFLDEEPSKLADLEFQLNKEKERIDEILDKLLAEIHSIVEQKRSTLKVVFDQFLTSYSTARSLFQRKLNDFKDTTRIIGGSKIGGSGDRLITLNSMEFFDNTGKIKEEICNLKCKLGSLNKEIEKKYLSFYSQYLDKELCHRPSFSLTESSQEYLKDMTRIITEKVSSNLEILDSLIYKVDLFKFEDLSIKPIVKPSLGESKSNVIAAIKNPMVEGFQFKVEYIEGDYLQKINSVCVIEEDLVATGHSDCSVGIWNMSKNQKIATLKEHLSPVTSIVSIKAYFPELNLAEGTSVDAGYIKNKNIKQQNFLISGGEGTQAELMVWDLQAMALLKKFKGHNDTISSLVSLRDGHTVISGGLDAAVKAWDIADGRLIQTHSEEDGNHIYYIHIFNDFSHFMTASKTGDLSIFRMTYNYNRRFDRTVFDSCKKVRTIKTNNPVYVINESMIKDNLIISGGADKKVTFWNTVTGTEQRSIAHHQTDIIGCVMIENPLDSKANSYVMSFGNYEDRIQITDTTTGDSREMTLDTEISITGGKSCNPNFQFMATSDVFGKSHLHLISSGTRHGMPCLVKIRIDGQTFLK